MAIVAFWNTFSLLCKTSCPKSVQWPNCRDVHVQSAVFKHFMNQDLCALQICLVQLCSVHALFFQLVNLHNQRHCLIKNEQYLCISGTSGPPESHVEDALPIGQRLTVIGELVDTEGKLQDWNKSRHGSKPALTARKPLNGGPYMVSEKPFGDVVADCENKALWLKRGSVAFGLIAVTMLGVKIGRRIRQHHVRYECCLHVLCIVQPFPRQGFGFVIYWIKQYCLMLVRTHALTQPVIEHGMLQ